MNGSPLQQRRAGVLLHPTSLPGGVLGDDALRWMDFMAAGGLTVWQMLPLSIPDHAHSPYHSCSAFAVDPRLFPPGPMPRDAEIDEFRHRAAGWIEDFASYRLLQQHYPERSWERWPKPFAHRDPEAMRTFRNRHGPQIDDIVAEQCRIDVAFRRLRGEAAARGIALFGDVPIFVAYQSADVWANPQDFLLDVDLRPRWVAGVPPDYFSATGQRWGNPHYDWERLDTEDFRWWMQRFDRQFAWFDILRLDHFRGLESVWMIDADQETAAIGRWAKTPGDRLLDALRRRHPALPLVAEDLGIITDEVRELRLRFQLPGMAVLQFAFDGSPDNPHRPENIAEDTVVYTGTHDNDTTCGWFQSLDEPVRQLVFEVLRQPRSEDVAGILWRVALDSRACLAVAPLQDLLGLGSEARMNVPGVADGNWRWRFEWSDIPGDLAGRIRDDVAAARR